MSNTMNPVMRRSSLIAMLRDETLWPPGFKWDFSNCHTCAMGMLIDSQFVGERQTFVSEQASIYAGRSPRSVWIDREFLMPKLGLTMGEFNDIFVGTLTYPTEHPTAVMVADALEELHIKLVAQGR